MSQASFRIRLFPIHFARTFSLQLLGSYDPTASRTRDSFAKAFHYRDAPAALLFARHGAEDLEVTACGPHAADLAEVTRVCLAQDDQYHDFHTPDTGILRLHFRQPGLRILRFPWLWDSVNSAILQQRIRTVDAMRGWRQIARKWGAAAPLGLTAFPPPSVVAQIPEFDLRALDIDHQRAQTLLRFAQESRFHATEPTMSFAALRAHLLRQPGIGPWTTETVLGYGAGDTDAAIPGDLHLPHLVCYALAGEPEGTDERMLELLAPFAGHRFRIIRLLYDSGLQRPHR